ncbi:endonuclease V isoform X1 [Hippopotamus amphibius kiboko]|uniref:endonuclease V isoform X1 n=1 Tax=Hippopotamus amphibius kiboko TaxID=575201 RepID=UPI00259427CF|nr:endonuclease V isoform X1 [Hippopotamus amphibius kiboko]
MARKAVGRLPEETLSLWKREQAQLKTRVVHRDTEAWQRDPAFSGLQRVGGVDVSFVKGDSVSACASLVVLSYPELEVVYEDCCMVSLTAPYVSGFLAFREMPFLVEAVQRLREKEPRLMPQVLFVDGNGVLHHRGFGVACHLGVLTDLPCIGVAKKLLQVDGLENNALHKEKIRLLKAGGDSFPLLGGSGTILGMALKSHDHSTKPLYVSVGHKVSLEAAVRLTHGCCKFRIPEPVRQADIRSRDYIRRTLGVQGAPALRPERSKKAQMPKACREGVSEEHSGPGPSVHSPQAPGCCVCGFRTCTSVPAAFGSPVLAVPQLSLPRDRGPGLYAGREGGMQHLMVLREGPDLLLGTCFVFFFLRGYKHLLGPVGG